MSLLRKTKSKDTKEPQWNWLSKWWPCLLLFAIVIWGIVDYFFVPESDQTEFIKFLLNASGVLAVVMYVIYTRGLSESSQQIAQANVRLVESTQSRILEQWVVEKPETVNLIDGGTASWAIHVDDKEIGEERYREYQGKHRPRVLIFRPMNVGTRPVILKSVKFKIADSRSGRERDVSYSPECPVVLQKDSCIDIQVCYSIEGQINARVAEIDYNDGLSRQTIWLANPFTEKRYEEAEEPEEEPKEGWPEDEIPF